VNRADYRAAQRRASQATRAAGGNPALAAELESLRSVRLGSYALMHALVARLGGGPIEVPRGEWKALPPNERLKVKVDPETHDVRLWIEQQGESSSESESEVDALGA
jgi:hypothetical protein